MRNIFIIGALLAISLSASATPDYGVTTESVIVVDVGHELAVTAEMLVPGYEDTFIMGHAEFVLTATAIGKGYEGNVLCAETAFIADRAEILLDPGRICSEANSTSYRDNFLTGLTPLKTDLAFRKARDGLSC